MKHLVFYVTAYMKNGDIWQTKRGTKEESEEYFSLCWKDENVHRVEVEHKWEHLKLTNPEHIL